MTASDATIEGGGFKNFFKSVANATVNFVMKVVNNSVRVLEIASKIGGAAATKNPRADLAATPEFKKFLTTGKCIKREQ